MEKQNKPQVNKVALEASKATKMKAISNNQIVIKDGKDTGRAKG
jgi:hypothetical protein